ncbi:acyl-CoA dehydrogenase [Actinorhabdospora filicis]|uniref:Acyl-CoA dehydrogenase n=1 Tax=Actinorhabdospora filicis TaxID=1785913 RepID=A0A9W6SKW3_9ACTN|nr:acyl-CoA dehydrogenase family protein [Actinorhabdospora filicis]GLZ77672.1 acyl-CoA dehydrogenase [Actinorhabdospora filicis]
MTHEVFNQPPPYADRNLLADNLPLSQAMNWSGAGWARERAGELASTVGDALWMERAERANRCEPVLRTHDRYGHRVDEVDFHPDWHAFMSLSIGAGLHSMPWTTPRGHAARAAMFMLVAQVEAGHGCPVSMTYSSIPTLRQNPELAAEWEPLITSTAYDFGLRAPQLKQGLVLGMAMTEKQGGSDVRANTTRAERVDGGYALTGHKWFCSAPMSDAFLVLAQAPGGLSCFLLPRVLPDGTRNSMRLMRLKDKLGNRSNASSEVEYDRAFAHLVGEEGRGVRTIIEMVSHTRLDCVLATTAGMRQSTVEAVWHATHRSAFGAHLRDQPLMARVLADLCVEYEAALVTAMRLAAAHDDPADTAFRRLAAPVAKYWVCKRGPAHAAEALECLGGNGYVEEAPLARRYREQPLMSVWEGSGNVISLDVLRALATSPESGQAFLDELVTGAHPSLDAHVRRLKRQLAEGVAPEDARLLTENLALALQGSLLARHSTDEVLDAFCASRLEAGRGHSYGATAMDAKAIIDRHLP